MFPTYNEAIAPLKDDIAKTEGLRQTCYTALKHLLVTAGIIVVSVIVFGVLGLHLIGPEWLSQVIVFTGIGLVIYLIVLIIKLYSKHKRYKIMFKETIVRGISEQILEQCELPEDARTNEQYKYFCHYNPNGRVSDMYINSSDLFLSRIDRINGCDLFTGRIGLTDFQLSELFLYRREVTTDSKGNTSTRYVKFFQGVLFIADFHKDFVGVTTLHSSNRFNFLPAFLRRGGSSLFGKLGGLTSVFSGKAPKQSIDLEDVSFNEAFDIKTTDEVKARYLLTSSMMERIMTFKEKHPQRVDISFAHSLMCVAMESDRRYFEPSWKTPVANGQTKEIYDDLTLLFQMVEDFDLNTRIWMKE